MSTISRCIPCMWELLDSSCGQPISLKEDHCQGLDTKPWYMDNFPAGPYSSACEIEWKMVFWMITFKLCCLLCSVSPWLIPLQLQTNVHCITVHFSFSSMTIARQIVLVSRTHSPVSVQLQQSIPCDKCWCDGLETSSDCSLTWLVETWIEQWFVLTFWGPLLRRGAWSQDTLMPCKLRFSNCAAKLHLREMLHS